MSGFAVVTTTVATPEQAKAMAKTLVRDKLAACVQIIPIESVYAWNEAIEDASEWMLVCKIRAADAPAIETAILELHSYDTPEIIVTPILAGSASYLDWITASTAR